jgi:hypothetical protein
VRGFEVALEAGLIALEAGLEPTNERLDVALIAGLPRVDYELTYFLNT